MAPPMSRAISSSEQDYNSEAELAELEAFACGTDGLPPSAPPNAPVKGAGPGIGHNSDPGLDRSYCIGFHIPEWVPRDQVREFERVLQAQGPYPDRLAALDHAAYRVRADRSVSHRNFRLYDGVTDTSKGEHRCSLFDLDKLGFIVGIQDRSNLVKVIDEVEAPGIVKVLRFSEGRVGTLASCKVLIAPVITAEDRAQATAARILAEAEAAKRAVLEKRAEAERTRYRRKHPEAPSGRGDHQENGSAVEATTRPSGGYGDHQDGLSGGRPDFSGGRPDRLLSHIKRSHKDNDKEESARVRQLSCQLRSSPPARCRSPGGCGRR
jgi:hypothetical protein